MTVPDLDRCLQERQFERVWLFRQLEVLIQYFPDMFGRSHRLRHRMMKPRKLSHWIIGAGQQKQESKELCGVEAAEPDFALAEEQQDHNKEDADQLDYRRRHA